MGRRVGRALNTILVLGVIQLRSFHHIGHVDNTIVEYLCDASGSSRLAVRLVEEKALLSVDHPCGSSNAVDGADNERRTATDRRSEMKM